MPKKSLFNLSFSKSIRVIGGPLSSASESRVIDEAFCKEVAKFRGLTKFVWTEDALLPDTEELNRASEFVESLKRNSSHNKDLFVYPKIESINLDNFEIRYIDEEVGYGVFAARDIPENTLLCLYAGEVWPELRDSAYNHELFTDRNCIIDAKQMSGIGSFFQHLPQDDDQKTLQNMGIATANVHVEVRIYNGLPYLAMVSTRDLKRGEQVGFSYMNHKYCKKLNNISVKYFDLTSGQIVPHDKCLAIDKKVQQLDSVITFGNKHKLSSFANFEIQRVLKEAIQRGYYDIVFYALCKLPKRVLAGILCDGELMSIYNHRDELIKYYYCSDAEFEHEFKIRHDNYQDFRVECRNGQANSDSAIHHIDELIKSRVKDNSGVPLQLNLLPPFSQAKRGSVFADTARKAYLDRNYESAITNWKSARKCSAVASEEYLISYYWNLGRAYSNLSTASKDQLKSKFEEKARKRFMKGQVKSGSIYLTNKEQAEINKVRKPEEFQGQIDTLTPKNNS